MFGRTYRIIRYVWLCQAGFGPSVSWNFVTFGFIKPEFGGMPRVIGCLGGGEARLSRGIWVNS